LCHAESQTSFTCKGHQCDVHTNVSLEATATPLHVQLQMGLKMHVQLSCFTLLIIWLQAERHALRKDVTRAQTQLLEAQTSSRAAEAAASTNHEEKVAMAESLLSARFDSNCPAAVLTQGSSCGDASIQMCTASASAILLCV